MSLGSLLLSTLCVATGIQWFLFVLQGLQKNIYVSHGTVCGIFSSYFMQQEVVSQESLVYFLEVEDTIFRNHLAAQESLICMMRRSPKTIASLLLALVVVEVVD